MGSGFRIVRILFVIFVLIPSIVTGVYFVFFSKDQYRSTFSFSVTSEVVKNPLDFLSTTSSSPDSYILSEFVRSLDILEKINNEIDLYEIYRKGKFDPVYHLTDDANQEDLLEIWDMLVDVFHDSSSGIIRIDVYAFTAEDTTRIADQIILKSRELINEISNVSQDEKLVHVRTERAQALANLRASQKKLADFRSEFQIVDPSANLQTQIELIKSLQEKYIDSTIELELMRDILNEGDTRVLQAKRKNEVLQRSIEDEKNRIGSIAGESRSDLVFIFDQYERLSINVELDREIYSESIRAYTSALSEANMKDKFLAVHISPDLPQTSEYPKRFLSFFLLLIAYSLTWFCASLVYYSVRDRA